MSRAIPAFLAILTLSLARSQSPSVPRQTAAIDPAKPSTVTLPKECRLNEALAMLAQQTGMNVSNARPSKDDPILKLLLKNSSFWQALDTIARRSNSGLSLYLPEGGVALSGRPYRPVPTYYGGIFRSAVKRVNVELDMETGVHVCVLALEIAWEPRYRPFYLEVSDLAAEFAADAEGQRLSVKQPGKGYESVVGRVAHEVELRVPAPKRSSPAVTLLRGNIKTIGPSKMLTFTFAQLKPIGQAGQEISQTQEGIRASLRKITVDEDRWTVEVGLDYPPGGPAFQSYQSWLGNNAIALERGGKRVTPKSNDQRILLLTNNRAVVQYYFTPPPKTRIVDWSLVLQTPGRILETSVPFEFRDVLLP
jgi:hypothetical protein